MKYKFKALCLALCAVLFVAACSKKNSADSENTVVVWTYDSFTSEWGPGGAIAKNFKEKTGITLRWESEGDAGALLSRLQLEGSNAGADAVLGLDNNMAARAEATGLFEAYRPADADRILPDIDYDAKILLPYDYSYFSIIYDSKKVSRPPRSLEDLCLPEHERSVIVMDPRTSSPGLGFLSWTKSVYGDGVWDYWRRLRPSLLTVVAGWDEGYGLFTKGEASLVLSYTTSPAYHKEYENTTRYKAAFFPEGHPEQVELAGLLAAAPHKDAGRLFLEFMLSDGFQKEVPGNWMYPVVETALPDSFGAAPKPERHLSAAPVSEDDLDTWADVIAGK